MAETNSIVKYMSQSVVRENINEAIGKKTPQFIASVASLVANNKDIAKCEQKSVLSACLVAASLDLPINQNLGFAYIIPYKNNKTKTTQAQFQMGYKGYIQLAMRSGQFKTINVTDVREGELVGNDRLTGELKFDWVEENRDKLPVLGYVAYFELTNGFFKSHYKTVSDLKKHGLKFSQSYKKGYGLWSDDFDSMAVKTVLKLLLSKFAPMTIDMQKAVISDQAVISGDSLSYVDNEPLDPEAEATEREIERIKKHIKLSKSVRELEMCKDSLADYSVELSKLYDDKKLELQTMDSIK